MGPERSPAYGWAAAFVSVGACQWRHSPIDKIAWLFEKIQGVRVTRARKMGARSKRAFGDGEDTTFTWSQGPPLLLSTRPMEPLVAI